MNQFMMIVAPCIYPQKNPCFFYKPPISYSMSKPNRFVMSCPLCQSSMMYQDLQDDDNRVSFECEKNHCRIILENDEPTFITIQSEKWDLNLATSMADGSTHVSWRKPWQSVGKPLPFSYNKKTVILDLLTLFESLKQSEIFQ